MTSAKPVPTVKPHPTTERTSPGPDRRTVLRGGAVAGVSVLAVSALSPGASSADEPVFRHGVASGDPMPDRVILWTRVMPTPDAHPGSGAGPAAIVSWELAADPGFGSVVAAGSVSTDAGRDHTVKVDAAGLAPDSWLYYRFHCNGQTSPVGRTRTAPAEGAAVGRLRVGLVSCSNWEAGYYSAYRHLAQRQDLDAIVEVGDYIYEYGVGNFDGKNGVVRPHLPAHEIVSLADYRVRLGQYRSDPDLQALHAHVPWICTWDDHEVSNDQWAGGAENHQPQEGPFPARRVAATRAYFEWLPVRSNPLDTGRIYRRLSWGALAEISMLDLRTYRSEQPKFHDGRAIDDPGRTMTGAAQFDWLTAGLRSSAARWNIIGNSVMISPVLVPPLDPTTTAALTRTIGLPEQGVPYNADQWDGYAAERRRLLGVLAEVGRRNTVFLTGDIHSSWACDLPIDPAGYPGKGIVGAEFVCTSVTSKNIDDFLKLPEGNPLSLTAQAAITGLNHHVRWVDLDRHGYTVVEFTEGFAHADYFAVTAKEDPRAGVYRLAGWRLPHGGHAIEPAGPLS